MALGAAGLGSAGLGSTGGSGLPVAPATIANGDIIFFDQLDDPLFAVASHDRTGTLLQRFVNGDDSTPNYGPINGWYAQAGTGILAYGYRDSTNTGNCIFKISGTGALSDFILNAAIADLEATFGDAVSVAVDNTGRIYVFYIDFSVMGTGVARRFLADGTFDADFSFSAIAIAGYVNPQLLIAWTVSPDGRYIYGSQVIVESFPKYGLNHHQIYQWDTQAAMAHTLIKDYPEVAPTVVIGGDTFLTGETHEDLTGAISVEPSSGDLFVAIFHRDQATATGPWTHDHRVDRLQADGTLVISYDVSAAIAGWTDRNTINGSGDFGKTFGFDAIGSGHAWIFLANVVPGNTHTWLVSIDLGSGAIATAANYVLTFNNGEWLVVYSGEVVVTRAPIGGQILTFN